MKKEKKGYRITGLVVPFGLSPNANGHIYNKDSFAKAFGEYEKLVKEGKAFGCLDKKDDNPFYSVSVCVPDVSHRVTDMRITNNGITMSAEILDTPKGDIVRNIIDSGNDIYIAPRMVGNVDGKGNVTVQNITSFDIVMKSAFDVKPMSVKKKDKQ